MVHKFKRRLGILVLSALLFGASLGAASTADTFFEVARGIELFTKIYKEIAFNYVDEIHPGEFLLSGIRGMLATLDPYTIFMDEKKQEDIDLLTTGKYGGIGVTIGLRDNRVTLLEILDGYSAQKQGLQVGDIILKVDSTIMNEQNFDRISSFVKGEPGTFVHLLIGRNNLNDTLPFELLREEIKVKSVAYSDFIDSTSGIVYLKLTQFSRTAGDEVKNAFLALKKKGPVKGVILDLRNNPGGLLDVAVDIANKFIPKGQLVVSTMGRDSSSLRQYFAGQTPLFATEPLIVLMNEYSASASEILGGAIQDHDRGIILGVKSFGKGLVQTIAPLAYNTSLKITSSKYYTPSGRCIQKIDYSRGNKVIVKTDTLLKNSFSTDGKRAVFAGGGIAPDTTVEPGQTPPVLRDMLAKGIFFKLANRIVAAKKQEKLSAYTNDYLMKELLEFLSLEKFVYHSEFEKKIEELAALSAKDKQFAGLKTKVDALRIDAKASSSFDIEEYRNEILEELKIELASRMNGGEGRISESLKYDNQFLEAVRILQNNTLYTTILSGK